MSTKKQKQLEIARRRVRVEQMYLAGKTYRDIAQELNVSVGTVAGDMQAVMTAWREQTTADLEDFKNLQMKRLNQLLASAWGEATTGDAKMLAQVRGILNDMNKLMGIEDSVRIDQSLRIEWAEPLGADDDIGIGADEIPS